MKISPNLKTHWQRLLRREATSPREETPLLLGLFSLDQLHHHAKALALRHELDPVPKSDPLLPRLADNEKFLMQAYEILSTAVHEKQRLSPAGEWILDNFPLIEEQIRIARRHLPEGYSLQLPRLANGPNAGSPRVYSIAVEVIAYVDGRVDAENITTFVAAYQEVTQLNLGEFWAIPIMLRLALIENLRRVAARVIVAMSDRSLANQWADAMISIAETDPKNMLLGAADMARSKPPLSNAFVAEFVRRLHGQSSALAIPLTWIDQQLSERGSTTTETVYLEGQQQAANQVSVSASIVSLRFLAAMDWRIFVESLSAVEKELRQDPAQVYSSMDFATRDNYRHVVEGLARRCQMSEKEVARSAIALARGSAGDVRLGHVGYYLVDEGLAKLEEVTSAPLKFSALTGIGQQLRLAIYVGSIAVLALTITGLSVSEFAEELMGGWIFWLFAALALGPASEVAVALINWLAMVLVKPRLLPRLDFGNGIPSENRTIVAIPCLLSTPLHLERLLEAIEVRYLANRDENLHFALLTDLLDAYSETLPTDEAAIALAVKGIESLNEKYSNKRHAVFFLFHRKREWNVQEKQWMGYERKRGKLEALNALLRGRPSPSAPQEPPFSVVAGKVNALTNVKYVITLDSDTQLPRDTAQKLVATLAHPLNRPIFDETQGRVTAGYGILQPRVAVSLPGSRRSLFVRLYAGDVGIDPYTRAVSDVYQDVFREGSFIGKGIYDIDVFAASLAGKLPENRILSHDLLEGSFARCGLVSDVQLYEEHPFDHGEDAKRHHRWVRGDWQIGAWLLPTVPGINGARGPNPLSALSKWKIFDNLRRSAAPVATVLLIILGWWQLGEPWHLLSYVFAMILLPPLLASFAGAMRKASEVSLRMHVHMTWVSILRNLAQAALTIVFLLHVALSNLDAIVRSSVRMLMTHTRLLEWRSTRDPRDGDGEGFMKFFRVMARVPFTAVLFAVAFAAWREQAFVPALPLLSLWFSSPFVASWLSKLQPQRASQLNPDQAAYLRRLSRKTWRFFETFVGPDDNWLPPDNFQEYPHPIIAHRTSPTNIGLSLLSNLAAYDFGYISSVVLVERTSRTFGTMEKMERYHGHFYNWYDTVSLAPLPPAYVSTVDSGNLAGLLLTLKPGLKEVPDHRIIGANATRGLWDTVGVLMEVMLRTSEENNSSLLSKLSELAIDLTRPLTDLAGALSLRAKVREVVSTSTCIRVALTDSEQQWWLQALERQALEGLEDSLKSLAPWTLLGPPPDEFWTQSVLTELQKRMNDLNSIPTLREVPKLGERLIPLLDEILRAPPPIGQEWLQSLRSALHDASERAVEQMRAIDTLVLQCEELATFEYDFLYDKSRHLLTIGYNVSEHRRDGGYYDLLASEARLCSFVAIAQGYLPQEHWFSLGRLMTTSSGEPTLLSWSGSMFEYLMPLLVMPTFENTLLDQTYKTCVKRQIEYGQQRGVPWGISESGYNATDVNLNYQYRAFGVPGLGFKRGLADDLVIAPYASVMSVMVEPEQVCANLQRMTAMGFEGKYGFYEAIDYTPARLSTEQSYAILKSFMAHHQGMSFLSLAYHLLDRKMQKRFQSDPLFQSVELLLYERVPKVTMFHPNAREVAESSRLDIERDVSMRIIATPDTPRPEVHLLSNGRYTVMVTNAGGGFSRWKDLALTRWREDPTCDNWGTFCYVRDITSGAVWSATHQPTIASSSHYAAIFPQARAEFRRRDQDIEMHTEIAVSPEDDIELRRISITNLSSRSRTIELTSYAEVVLATQSADEAHTAFSNLFVQTEIIKSKQAILCTRRPRSDKEKTPTMLHLLTVHGATLGETSFETERLRFIGRGRSVASPQAMEAEALSGRDGSVLDPIVAIRCRVDIGPEQTVKIHFVTGVGETRDAALALLEKYRDRHLADRVFELAWTHRHIVLQQLSVSEADAQLYGRLASSILYASPSRRPSRSILVKNRRGQSGLWGYGISGDLPIVVLRSTDQGKLDIVRQVIQAHSYWRTMGLIVDLVIWNEDEEGYRQLLQERIMALIAASSDVNLVDKPGGIFVRRAEQMSEEDRILLQTVARAIVNDTGGTLAEQIERRGRMPHAQPPFEASRLRDPHVSTPEVHEIAPKGLLYANGLGGFSPDAKEYVITTSAKSITPAPWVNVIANPYFGTVVSESGAAYTWCENAHEFRLTPWHNDALTDSSGEAFYVRDEESGEFWSPTPLPARASTPYVTRHGFGYSKFEVAHAGIQSELTTFVAIDAPVKFALIKLLNISDRPRHISVTGYCEWALGELRNRSLLHVVSEIDPQSQALFARNPYHSEFGGRIAFFDVNEKKRTVTADRTEFIGRNGNLASPVAMNRARLSGKAGAALDACAAMQTSLEMAEGEVWELVFVLGVGRDVEDVRTLLRRFCATGSAHAALEEVQKHWEKTLSAVQIKTPDPTVDVLVNGWLLYQVIACRIWARSGFYQSGGAFGFRDQLQDAMALVHTEPALLRAHILNCAARQFREGDVQHWWHPPSGRGVRTHFSDDYLWLPLATSRYVMTTGDVGALDVRVPFIEGRPVKLDEEGYSDLPTLSDESGTLYEHCVRAINRGLRYGQHGLPLMGCGDWNDGMNLVGEHGRGESVWLAFFLFDVLGKFSQVARRYGDEAFAAKCATHRALLQPAIETHGWDGQWYRRAYFDDGRPLGSSTNDECQIDSLPQSWSVLSGAGDVKRSRQAMEFVSERLVDRKNKIVKLFDPPFDSADMNPGYIKGYVPGVRENGGQYTHAAIWAAMAYAEMGDQKRAWELLTLINPLSHGSTPDEVETYKVEPYVMSADVYAVEPHVGRGGWSWYTGAAGWMYRLILESLLGVRLNVDRLTFAPCVPSEWKDFILSYRYRETTYFIRINVGTQVTGSRIHLTVDGRAQEGEALLLVDDRVDHVVVVNWRPDA